jgi:Mg2+ and Co2+ transporter CorA
MQQVLVAEGPPQLEVYLLEELVEQQASMVRLLLNQLEEMEDQLVQMVLFQMHQPIVEMVDRELEVIICKQLMEEVE